MPRPRTSVYIAATVDGFIARPDDGLDWLDHDAGDDDYGWVAFRESVDAILLGRRTYERVLGFGVPWPYVGLASTVWSRSLTQAEVPPAVAEADVRVSGAAPADVLAEMGARGAAHVWLDGGQTVQAFLAEGLVDRLTVTRLPVLIGQGVPLFGALPADIRLAHEATTSFASGVVQSTYRLPAATDGAEPLADVAS